MTEKLVDVFAKLRQRGKKDQPPKLYVVTILIFMIKRTNGLTTYLLFSFFNTKNLGRSDDAKRRGKKGDGLIAFACILARYVQQ